MTSRGNRITVEQTVEDNRGGTVRPVVFVGDDGASDAVGGNSTERDAPSGRRTSGGLQTTVSVDGSTICIHQKAECLDGDEVVGVILR